MSKSAAWCAKRYALAVEYHNKVMNVISVNRNNWDHCFCELCKWHSGINTPIDEYVRRINNVFGKFINYKDVEKILVLL